MTNKSIEEQLTAYVLGELSEAEQEIIVAVLETDEDAQFLLQEIRVAVGLSREALKTQPSVALSPDQRNAIEQATASPTPARASGGREKITLRRLALAALFLMIFGGLSWAAWIGLNASSEVNIQTAEIANLGEEVESISPGGVIVAADPDLTLDQLGIGTGRSARLNGETIERLRNLGYIGGAEDSGASGDVRPDGSAVVTVDDLGRQGQPGAVQAEVSNRAAPVSSAESSNVRIVLSQPQAISVAGPDGSDVLTDGGVQVQQLLGIEQTQVQLNPSATGEDPTARPIIEAFELDPIGPIDETAPLLVEEHETQRVGDLVELAEQYLEFQFHDQAVDHFEQVLLIAPDNKRAQRGLHEATLSLFQDQNEVAQGSISQQSQRMRFEIEKMKLLPEGADPSGIRNPSTGVAKALASTGTDLERLGALGYVDGRAGGGFGGGGGVQGGGGFGGVSKRLVVARRVVPLLGDLSQQAEPQSTLREGVEVRVRVAGLPSLRYQTPLPRQTPRTPGTESYAAYSDNGFVLVGNEPLSTFSIDVDTASYANMRRFLRQGQLPPPDAVRIEELINYFDYDYAGPEGETPFAAHMTVASAPWRPEHRLVRIGLKGVEMTREERPAANLVFLLDVSGSMKAQNKLPLVKRAIALLVRQLTAADRVAMVTYAGSSGLALPSTRGDRQGTVLGALERLEAGGSTNGGAGIELAYRVAAENFVPGGINRVILATDGDFNVGITDRRALEGLIEDKARGGVFLTALGFGMGNLKDSTLETLSNKGNGNYAYIDTLQEARKVFVDELMGTLVTIAKDVKIQVEFNPQQVAAYRLIGYENRALAAQDFNDDAKDAGEIGAGHTVTALYEIVPAGMTPPGPSVDPLRYRSSSQSGTEDEEAMRLAMEKIQAFVDEGRYLEAVAELQLLRYDSPRHFDRISRRMIEIKQLGGLSLTTSEKLAVDRDAGYGADAVAALQAALQRELLTLKVRYKEPEGSTSKLLTFNLTDPGTQLASAPSDFKFAAAVASFGQMLRQSPHVAAMDYDSVMALAEDGMAADLHGYRAEFIDLLRMARPLVAPTYRTSRIPQSSSIDLELLNIQQISDGTYRVRIRTSSRRAWYSEGEGFESYELLSIDPATECIVVFAEEIGRRVEICLEG